MRSIYLFFFATGIAFCNLPGKNSSNTDHGNGNNKASTPQLVFDKLVGTWQSGDQQNFERWAKNENGTFRSVAFSAKGKDTSWNEQADIYREKGQWVFENTVKGQNDNKPVKFTSTLLTENSVQFSNPAHDFPTDVNYTVQDQNKVNAFIIGPNGKGGRDTVWFHYKRIR
jgi:hypothetical protein